MATLFVSQHLIFLHLEQFILDCKARRLSQATLRYYSLEVTRFLKWLGKNGVLDIADVTPSIIRTWMVYQREEEQITDVSVNTNFRAIRRFFNWLEDEEEIEKNPISKIKPPKVDTKRPTSLSMDEVSKILKVCDKREKAIITFLIDTMLRASECVALKVQHVDFSTGKVLIHQAKSRKFRVVFIGIKTRKHLLKYLTTRDNVTAESPLFISETRDLPITYSGLAQAIRRISKRVGIPFSAHELRRTGVTLLHRNNDVDIYTLKELLGHSTLDMLKHYLRIDEVSLSEQSSKFSTIDAL